MKPLPAIIASVLLISACNSPTEPTHGMPLLSVGCGPSGATVVCRADAYNIGNVVSGTVTAGATWLSSGASGSFPQPGVFVPTSSGEVTIWARYEWAESAPSMFLVDPNAPARRLSFVGGNVTDAATNQVLAGATVRVLDGYAAGKTSTTNSLGYYSIKPILTGETFTIEASKEGYVPVTLTYRVDTHPFFDIKLQPRS